MNPSANTLSEIKPSALQNLPMSPNDDESKLSPLASHYMSMFDPQNLLTKRPNPAMSDPLMDTLQKKLKVTQITGPASQVQVPSIMNPLLLQHTNLLAGTETGLLYQDLSERMNMLRNQRMQYLGLLLSLQQQNSDPLLKVPSSALKKEGFISPLQTLQTEKALKVNKVVKIKEGNCLKKEESPLSTDSKPSVRDNYEEKFSQLSENELLNMPVLSEFTRKFPDWDLTTIFNYLRSGKSRVDFEKERKPKVVRQRKSNFDKRGAKIEA